MCGIIGLVRQNKSSAALRIYDALTVIQHRGQDAAGIATSDGKNVFRKRNNGLVREVFNAQDMQTLIGHMGIGHCRYPTAGTSSNAEAQPFYVNSPYGIVMAHNGNLNNTHVLTEELFRNDLRHLNTDSDSEVLLNIFAHELAKRGKVDLRVQDIFDAVTKLHERCHGAYAVVSMILGHGVLGFRDPYGIRPLVIGHKSCREGTSYMLASESVAFTALGYKLLRDVEPGEAVFIDANGSFHSRKCAPQPGKAPCIFEFVYLARPDSIIDGISVYKARLRMGEFLAQKIIEEFPRHDIDVVIPIPDTSRTAALPIAHELGVKYREGFIKNRYIGRTFIMPGQAARKNSIRRKLNPIALEFAGKNVLLVDDSIVRGNTCKQIVKMARNAGANNVYIASAAPPVRYPNVYGIDMPVSSELIACNRSAKEVAKEIGADRLFYQDMEKLHEAVLAGNQKIKRCEASCFDGHYITQQISHTYLSEIEAMRNEQTKAKKEYEQLSLL